MSDVPETTAPGYPPLTSLDEYPLHPRDVYDGELRWACFDPERPTDGSSVYDWRCRACVLAAQATIVHNGDLTVWWKQSADEEEQEVTLSWLVARAVYWQKRAARRDLGPESTTLGS